jgi:hypothetical protein
MTRATLPRHIKILIDQGLTPDEAFARVERSLVRIVIDEAAVNSRIGQITAFIAVASATRSFGRVYIDAADAPLKVRWSAGHSFLSAVVELGAQCASSDCPAIVIGSTARPELNGVRVIVDGSTGGVAPTDVGAPFDLDGFVPAAVMGGSLAVLDLFMKDLLSDVSAGTRERRVTLFPATEKREWSTLDHALPTRLGFLGLGHLGQAALFVASLMGPLDDRRTYTLQDMDAIEPANYFTQLLVTLGQTGRKTTACADWLKTRGIGSISRDFAFDSSFKANTSEPAVHIAGFDSPEPRRTLDVLGNAFVVDAGIGGGASDFSAFRIYTFPQGRLPSEIFAVNESLDEARARAMVAAAYGRFAKNPEERCGLVDAGGAAVGVPFVGTAIAALTLSQVLRRAIGATPDAIVSGDLRLLSPARSVPGNTGAQRDGATL